MFLGWYIFGQDWLRILSIPDLAEKLTDQCFDGFAQIIASDGYAIAYSKLQSQEASVSVELEDASVNDVKTKEGGYCKKYQSSLSKNV